MTRWPYAGWATAGFDTWLLGLQAANVAALRTFKIVSGGDADGREARRMVTEKFEALAELQLAMMTGALGTTALAGSQAVLRHYGRKVAANRRRLG